MFSCEYCEIQKSLWLRCFPMNFAKFLRTPFLTEHHRWLLLISGQPSLSTTFEKIKNHMLVWFIWHRNIEFKSLYRSNKSSYRTFFYYSFYILQIWHFMKRSLRAIRKWLMQQDKKYIWFARTTMKQYL